MKNAILSIALLTAFVGTVAIAQEQPAPAQNPQVAPAKKTSTPAGWIDDFSEAKKLAKQEGKMILVDFSGSDWCGWCRRLDQEVFSKKEFLDSAPENYVLLFIDSPNNKGLLSDKAKEQNPRLVEQYKIKGFPTVLILSADGDVIGTTGYEAGGPQKYLKNLKKISEFSGKLAELKESIKALEKGTEARVKKIRDAVKHFTFSQQMDNREVFALIDEVVDFYGTDSAEMCEDFPYFAILKPYQEKVFAPLGAQINEKIGEAFEAEKASGQQPNPADMQKKVAQVMLQFRPQLEDAQAQLDEISKKIPNSSIEAKRIATRMRLQLVQMLTLANSAEAPENPPQAEGK